MAATVPATVRLNNRFQAIGQLGAISYTERDNGPMAAAECRWYAEVKIHGKVMGSSNAPYKAEAKELAAEQALRKLAIRNFLRLCEI